MSHLLDPHALHTDAEYRAALAELEQLLLCDPGTPAGHRLDELVALIEAYEVRGRQVELAADAELRRVWARAWATFGLPHDVPDAAAADRGRRQRDGPSRRGRGCRSAPHRTGRPAGGTGARPLSDHSGVANRTTRKSMNERTLAERWRRLGYTALMEPAGAR